MQADSPLMEFPTEKKGDLKVELAPCVISCMRWPPSRHVQAELFQTGPDSSEARHVLQELKEALRRVNSLHTRLANMFGADETSRSKQGRKDKKRGSR